MLVWQSARNNAQQIRDTFPVGSEGIRDLVGIAQHLGATIYTAPLEPAISGFIIKDPHSDPRIYINENESRVRQRVFSRSQKALKARKSNGEKLNKYFIKNYQEKREKVAHVHARVAAQRLDFLNKVTTDIVKNHDIISVETLKVKNLMKNRKLAKSIANASWGAFVQLLEQKCQTYGKILVKVDRFFASTQFCSHCGVKSGPQGYRGLKVREWTCSHCDTHHDRDENAAINVCDEGYRVLIDEIKNNSRVEPPVMALGLLEYSGSSRGYGTSDKTPQGSAVVSNQDKRTKKYQLV